MQIKVGIPRALFYYRYFPLWKTFFEELGAEVIVSDPTDRKILDAGVKACVDEACLPLKLFHGHVINLRDKVDFLFIPRFTSVSRNEYICPKFGGLPDVIRHSVPDLPELITTEINMRKSKRNLWIAAVETGQYFTGSRHMVRKAFEKAVEAQRLYEKELKKGKEPCSLFGGEHRSSEPCDGKEMPHLRIAVIGHPYILNDKYINMDMLGKLKRKGVEIITPDMVEETVINTYASCLSKPVFWNYARKAIGSALYAVNECSIDGMIYVMSFGCGIDSFICDLIERRIKRSTDIPLITLTIDEHSGEAGINTRLEAFLDMIVWRKANENNIPASG